MAAKDTVALGNLLALLESRYAMRVLWALKDGHPQTFRLLQDSVGQITPNTLNTRIKEHREAGFMTHGSEGYTVTPSGMDLLKRLNDLQAFATKWGVTQSKKPAK
jgi:DNA-binding HxlR family transcriptional regulator